MTLPATVCVVDDDEAVRDSLDALLGAANYKTHLFETAAAFLKTCSALDPGCVLLDVRLPDADGIDVLGKLMAKGFNAPIIILTGHGDVPMAVKAMRIGAADFIEKPFDPDVLLASLQQLITCHDRTIRADAQAQAASERLARLSPRETDVMVKLVIGSPNKIIAHELGLSPRTIEIHRARVMQKTEAQSLSHLVRIAIAAGIDADSKT